MAKHLGTLPDPDGKNLLAAGAYEDVFQGICQGDGAIGSQFHRHRAAHLLLHRSGHLHTDEVEHPESVDATLGDGLYHQGNHAA